MSWKLEIWHMGLKGSGDSTIIIATDGKEKASALIDAGRANDAAAIDNRLGMLGISQLDVMIASHYDTDHFSGLTSLLKKGSPRYSKCRIYDQGQQANGIDAKRKRGRDESAAVTVEFSGKDDTYMRYETAIKHPCVRVTAEVFPFEQCQFLDEKDLIAAGYHNADWLVGREVLWDRPLVPTGAPTLTCIAANQYILQKNGTTKELFYSELTAELSKNQRSLAFLLQFGNFKYYIGGDIEAYQEDGSKWDGNGYTVNQTARAYSLMQYLNQTGNAAGRVLAMKTSHHGSKLSSSPAFLERLKPSVAVISCGRNNRYSHPDQEVINSLEGANCQYFLTGEDLRNRPPKLGKLATVAGVVPPSGPRPAGADSDIQLWLTQDQAAATPAKFQVDCNRPDAGTNLKKEQGFKYVPWRRYTDAF